MFGFILSRARRSGWKRRPTRLAIVAGCLLLAGCLADNSPIEQVVPRIILAPQNPRFQAPDSEYVPNSNPPAGCMLVKWNRSVADTQLNFKGYFVKLYRSSYDSATSTDSFIFPAIDSVHIGRILPRIPDTTCTFCQVQGQSLTLGRYAVSVFGEKADSTGTLSYDSSTYASLFDPLPYSNPTNLEAESYQPTVVRLHWTPSPQESDIGFYQYVIYYRDTSTSIFDTGHVCALIQKRTGWMDSEAYVSVPGVTQVGGTTAEWPYQFWIKSERVDSTYFYGSDTNSLIWAGAERLPRNGNDTGSNTGFLQVKDGQSIYFGSLNNQWDLALDTIPSGGDGKQQVTVHINNGEVTLNAISPDGVGFLSRMDEDSSLDSIYYSYPLAIASEFSSASITLPSNPTSGGIIVYFMMMDPLLSGENPNEWARIFIRAQPGGGYVNSNGAIDLQASFQPAVSKGGNAHLPYY